MPTAVASQRSRGSPLAPSRAGRRIAQALLAAAVLAACDSATGLEDVGCGVPVPNPSVPLGSGFAQRADLDLAPGAGCAIRAEAGGAFRLAAGGAGAEYLLAVQSASTVPAALASLSLRIEGPGARASVRDRRSGVPPATSAAVAGEWASRAELTFRRNARRELARVGARPYRGRSGPGVGPRAAVAPSPPHLGETVLLRSSVDADLTVDCERTDTIDAVVRAVGAHFAIVEDPDVAGHFDAAHYGDILAGIDDLVFPVATAYFGSPADLDGNDRVLVFITPIVNRATPRGTGTLIAGFFNPSDLSDRSACPASNRGEILYILAPDPAGQFGDPVDVDFAAGNAVGVTAHELAHLLEAEQRLVFGGGGFPDLEDAWLSEGLAHTAETVVGLSAAGLSPRGNHGFGGLTADIDVFNTYHLANFRRTGVYLRDPSGTLALGDETSGDPGGVQSLEMRGFAWLFLRWLADQATLSGAGVLGGAAEESLFRDLASGGTTFSRGVANIERVAGPLLASDEWRDLISRYARVPLADDAGGSVSAEMQVTTFNLPDTFAGLHEALPGTQPFTSVYPLEVTRYALDTAPARTFDFDVQASATRFFVLTSAGAHGAIDVTLTTRAKLPATNRH